MHAADPQWCLEKETFPRGCGDRGTVLEACQRVAHV